MGVATQSALQLFRYGKDTSEIADALGISEAEAYNRIHLEREHEVYRRSIEAHRRREAMRRGSGR